MRLKVFLTWVLLILLSLLTLSLSAKKVVCIAPDVPPPAGASPNDNVAINIAEGYHRSIAKDDDEFHKCANLEDLKSCIDSLDNGDKLVVIAHGVKGEVGFIWGPDTVRSWADMEFNDDWENLQNIEVHLGMCYSTREHTHSNPDKSGNTRRDIFKPLFGDSIKITGYNDIVFSSACLRIDCTDPSLNQSQRDAIALLAYMLLEKGQFNWMAYPPHNRPDVGYSMKQAALDYVNSKLAPYSVNIEVFFKTPYEDTEPNLGYSYINGRIVYGKEIPGDAGNWAEWLIQNMPTLFWFHIPDGLLPASGGWSSGWWFTDFFLYESVQPVRVRNVSFTGFENQISLPDEGLQEIVPNPIFGSFDVSYDEGHSYTTIPAMGILDVEIGQVVAGEVVDTSVFSMTPVAFHMQGLPPYDDMSIEMSTFFEPRGYGAIAQSPEGTQIAAGMTMLLSLTKQGFAPAVASMPAHITLACDNPHAGCMDPEAVNYDVCAFEDDGSCLPQIPGCIYPDAINYYEEATVDDGSCSFEIAACPGDFNDDGLISTTDLLSFLALFGAVCE